MRTCHACGRETAPAAAFCHHCGHRLESVPAADVTGFPYRRERKWVSILFADVRHSLQIIHGMDPERAQEFLAGAIDRMREAVDRYGGIVNHVAGDGIMALFGAPHGAEDHALRACAAALAMNDRGRTQALSPDASDAGLIEIRVGINTGEVLVHPTAGYASIKYDATGEAVHLAARMEELARPGEVYITGNTLAHAAGGIEVRSVGLRMLKGLDREVEAFQLIRLAPRRATSKRRSTGKPTPFVGRTVELQLLNELRSEAERGFGSAIQLTGDAGCGKSRLVDEFAASLPTDRWAIYRCQSHRYRRAGYRCVADLLERLLDLDFSDSGQPHQQQFECGLSALPHGAGAYDQQALAILLGFGDGDGGWKGLGPRDRRRRIEAAIAGLLNNLSRQGPTLFVIEDVHWLDEESASQFERFFETIDEKPVLVIATSRGKYEERATLLHSQLEYEVPPLSRVEAGQMLGALLQRGRGVAVLEERLIELTQGNPFFIEECLYSMIDAGAVEETAGGYRLIDVDKQVRVPPSIRGLLASRVDRIADQEKDVLQAASVVGMNISRSLLRPLVGLDESKIDDILENLCRDGFLSRQQASGPEFRFRHGLTREAVYESIPHRTRVAMHARLLELIEAWEGEHVELLADHAIRANAFDKAAEYCRRSGNKAFQRDAKEEAVRYLKQALEAVGGWPDGPEKDRALFDLHVDLRNPLFQLARIDELAVHMAVANSIGQTLNDATRLGRYYPYLSHLSWFRGNPDEALDAVRRTSELAASLQDAALSARAKFQEGLIWLSQSRYRKCVSAFQEVVSFLRENPDQDMYGVNASLAVTTWSYIARAHADCGREDAASDAATAAMAIADKLANPFASAFGTIAVGYHHLRSGRSGDAIPWLRRAVNEAQSGDAPLMIPVAASFLAWALVDSGEGNEGLELAAFATREAEDMGFRVFHPIRLAVLAYSLAANGRVAEGIHRADEAVQLARAQQEFGAEAYAMKVMGQAKLMRVGADAEEAISALRNGRSRAESFGLWPLVREIDGLLGHAVATRG